MKFRYHDRLFNSEQELMQILLAEASEQLKKIDHKLLHNINEHRIQIKFRLRAVGNYINHPHFEKIKCTYNTLWSRLYQLEHSVNFRHPYLKVAMEKIKKQKNEQMSNEKKDYYRTR
ncbi:hypothetical protein [Calidifontibacillus oryziterrae]|uniref:hypothetical protein n=1 Tax=Calidifontibacillus oryziterrae TaxID=1191699 RepID=UPI0003053E10|nr:hypothetical protein [Calidifontibacillus oryziterrae]